MVSEGAWMMSMPAERASASTGSIFSAMSPTLCVAPLHQCLSHISVIMIAVFAGTMADSNWASTQGPSAWKGWTWVRSCRFIGSLVGDTGAVTQADAVNAPVNVRSATVDSTMTVLCMGRCPYPILPDAMIPWGQQIWQLGVSGGLIFWV